MLWDLAEAISINTFRIWKNNIGKGVIKNFLKGGELKKGGDKYPLRTMLYKLEIFYANKWSNYLHFQEMSYSY